MSLRNVLIAGTFAGSAGYVFGRFNMPIKIAKKRGWYKDDNLKITYFNKRWEFDWSWPEKLEEDLVSADIGGD